MSRNTFTPLSTSSRDTAEVSVSTRDAYAGSPGTTTDTGSRLFSPVARNAIVHPVRTIPGRTSFVPDYQI